VSPGTSAAGSTSLVQVDGDPRDEARRQGHQRDAEFVVPGTATDAYFDARIVADSGTGYVEVSEFTVYSLSRLVTE